MALHQKTAKTKDRNGDEINDPATSVSLQTELQSGPKSVTTAFAITSNFNHFPLLQPQICGL